MNEKNRIYRIQWKSHGYVDTLALSQDGNQMVEQEKNWNAYRDGTSSGENTSQSLATTPTATVTDPIEWATEHKQYMPQDVVLTKKTDIPIMAGAKKIGSMSLPVGSSLHLSGFNKHEVIFYRNGSGYTAPIENTNFLELEKGIMAKMGVLRG